MARSWPFARHFLPRGAGCRGARKATLVQCDKQIGLDSAERPDVLICNRHVMRQGDNEPSNPITIIEFKKPDRDNFANPSATDDPVEQIVRYVNRIRAGKVDNREGRQIRAGANTLFCGYLICDIGNKVETWLQDEKDFKPTPDYMAWFRWWGNINLYMEVIGWDKLLKDATIRNKIFFHKLEIP